MQSLIVYTARVSLFWVIVWRENTFLGEVVIEKEIKLVYVFMNRKQTISRSEVKLTSVIVRHRIKQN